MSETVKLIKLFLASPSDVSKERIMVEEVVERINKHTGKSRKFRIECLTWERDTYPCAGIDAQQSISSQIGSDYDIFVGIMWHRLGTPTPRAESGTVEEFNNAFSSYSSGGSCRQIMMFFNSCDFPQSELEQASKVLDFKKSVQSKGIYTFDYAGPDFFKDLFSDKLQLFINSTAITEQEKEEQVQGVGVISESFLQFLSDPGASFTHPRKDIICFNDIYVEPYLKDLEELRHSDRIKKVEIDDVLSVMDENGIHLHIIGDDASGKTSLCKYLFIQYKDFGYYPVLIKGSDITNNIRSEVIKKRIEDKANAEYRKAPSFASHAKENFSIVLIIDDFQEAVKGNNYYWEPFMKNLESVFPNVIIIGNNKIQDNIFSDHKPFEKYHKYALMEFGPSLRYRIIDRWNKIGREINRNEDIDKLRRDNDRMKIAVDSIVGKDFIPAYPFYILGMLQAIESAKDPNGKYSMHGFYYEQLINDALFRGVKDQSKIGLYYNFLVRLCYEMFCEKKRIVKIEDLSNAIDSYFDEFDVDDGKNKKTVFIETLLNLPLMSTAGTDIRIAHKYIYYFFVAKYLSETISKASTRELISKMVERVFVDEYANIILFLSHLCKDSYLVDSLIVNADKLFSVYPVAKLEEDILSVNNLITNLPARVVEIMATDDERERQLRYEEELQQKESQFSEDTMNYSQFSLDDRLDSINTLAQMNLSLRTMDIMGQLLRKYWAEFDKDDKNRLFNAIYNLGLRTLSMYLASIKSSKDDIAEAISSLVREKYIKDGIEGWDPALHKDKINRITVNTVVSLCYMSSYGIVSRIASAVGDEQLSKTQKRFIEQNNSNAHKLVNFSVSLNTIGIPTNLVEEYSSQMRDNHLCYRLLQDFVVNYLHKFDVSYVLQSKIKDYLGIRIQKQQVISDSSPIRKG